jgi:alanine racemase
MERYERVCAIIDLGAFYNNVKEVIKNSNKNVTVISVVKADAYGHGAYECALTAIEAGAGMLGVAIAEEAAELREKGITAPILVMGAPFESAAADMIKADVCQTVFSLQAAEHIDKTAKKLKKKARVMIKLDTGMGRIGFLPEEKAADDIAKITRLENISAEGLFSHLACADWDDKTYSRTQNERFVNFISLLRQKGVSLPAHISNSAAIIDLKEYNYDFVRAGIMQYGYFPGKPNPDFNLMPVMSLRAKITNVKTIKAGECVGYNSFFKAAKETVVATLPIGYADGYFRKMRNGGRVLVNGEYAPVIGSVCMDQITVDVTNIKDVKIGGNAILMGSQNGKEVSCYEIANICETITYEIVCAISKRVPRLYTRL